MAQDDARLDVHLKGPAVEGRLPVDYLMAVAGELQLTLRWIASNRPGGPGRHGAGIESACTLELVAFKPGSVQLGFEFAKPRPDPTLWGDLGEDSLERLLDALERGEKGGKSWQKGIGEHVVQRLEMLTKPLSDGIKSMTLTRRSRGKPKRAVQVTKRFREHVMAARVSDESERELRVEGVIWETDWKEHTAELWEASGNLVRLSFSEDLDETVTAARRKRVVAHGMGRLRAGKPLKQLKLLRLEVLGEPVPTGGGGFFENASIDVLAERQGVAPVASIEDLAGDWPAEESIEDFLSAIREDRG